jgi:hypothetical protein
MRNWFTKLGLAAVLAVVPGAAFADGEVFKVEMSGTERCDDFDAFRFGSKSNVDLWVRIIDGQQWDLAFSPLFLEDETIPIIGITYYATQRRVVFSGAQFFEDAYIAIEAQASLDKNGAIKNANGIFTQQLFIELLPEMECFSSGKFKTTQRLL